jgi:EAL domain-containing protein (putative c-di-GMP-specific phosphodiesterase class I)/GGDEF domain-containing protein
MLPDHHIPADLPPAALHAALRSMHRLAQGDGDDVLARLLAMASETLGVARAGFWAIQPDGAGLQCGLMHPPADGGSPPDLRLAREAAPGFFEAVDGLMVVAVEDARHDPRTVGLAAGYLEPQGVGALLGVPISEFGETVGVLALEHLGAARPWRDAERLFLASLGGIVSQRFDRLRMAAAEEERQRRLLFDPSTGLAGRSLFVDRLAHAVAGLPEGHDLAVLALEVERLRGLAHRYGGGFVDSVMAEAAARIGQVVTPSCTGRVGDDTFAMWVAGDRAQGVATRLAGRLQRALALPMSAPDGDSLEFSAAVGIVPGARAEPDADRLLRDALTASIGAARKGRGRIEVVWPEVRNELQSSLELERDVRRAADAREFIFRLQPIVDLESGRAVGAEALMRWPRGGRDVSPADFVPLLEDSGLIAQVHMGLVRDLFAWARDIRLLARHPGFQLHVNFSPVQLQSPGFVAELRDTARAYGVEGLLVCEITENTLFSSGEDAATTLRYLAEMGIPVALDDFGTGFASLTHLLDLPLDGLKIDRSFCLRCADAPRARAVVAGLVGLARHLQLHVVAEGVETETQRSLLLALGATVAQGYLFDRALDLDAFAARWLAE